MDADVAAMTVRLRSGGVTDERVLAAMAAVPREEFVPSTVRGEAYADRALSIGRDQTISQPIMVA
ncbi:MAG: protein-L-isoaspartate O-methyltransferase, partial [Candidatus Dormibacteraeota bacterium]|nr:protein-L-isoaspartate O-methyltransferase [Candidatus Dormibacteraeota bacterium]